MSFSAVVLASRASQSSGVVFSCSGPEAEGWFGLRARSIPEPGRGTPAACICNHFIIACLLLAVVERQLHFWDTSRILNTAGGWIIPAPLLPRNLA